MSQKALDVLFRHKLLVLLPLVALVVAGAVVGLTRQSSTYSASAKVWTQGVPFLSTRLGENDNPFLTPAQNHSQVINDLLKLDSFALSVAGRVDSLSSLPDSQRSHAVRRGTFVRASGVNVLTISHHDDDPVLAQAIVQAVIDTYTERVTADVGTQADAAQAFYEQRLELAREDLDESKAALVAYQATLPAELLLDPTYTDAHLSELMFEVDRDREDYNSLIDRLEQIHLERDAALEGRDISFQIADAPALPSSPIPTAKRDLLMFPVLGLLLGITASGVVLFALIRLDEGIRLPSEAGRVGPVLAVVPDLARKRKRSWPKNFVRQVVFASRGLLGNMS